MTEIYNGSKNNEGIPNGQGTKISKESDGTITCIEEGIWENGFLVKGSNTSYLDSHILKEVGEWKLFEGGKNCSEFLSGYGEERSSWMNSNIFPWIILRVAGKLF